MHKQTNERIVFKLDELGIPRCLQFGHYKYNHVKPALKNHVHPKIIEICYFLKGVQCYQIGQKIFELKGNDILIIAPDTLHSTGMYPEDKGELYWIQVSLEQKKGALCYLPENQSDFLLQKLSGSAHSIFKGSFKLKSILMRLEKELFKPKDIMTELNTNQLILQLLLETQAASENKQEPAPKYRLQQIDSFINDQMERPIFVDELASLINLSVPYFKAWFKKQQGLPPKEYINRLKIERAKADLLIKPSITQVAFDLGYGSSQYFSTSFKKYTGITPKSYIAITKQLN
ncbi:AraC family transcriptional regulator [Maribacter sp. HTCC2170]|uniref:AraC family transcriptional regulator n=1 Tax=Maribacter sp. (strain HTCC2170 / KCCM 42371) TaxID=313603 RepID=UPI00006BD556|nr:AraC family transcriptional regulator [Maribacter sp. HTCC2170]EAR02346.1 two-component response regulator [Maribacter sp. HTCC2170]